ncbi:hypothetical protein AS593_07510 [Caulobacter vibrioides]|nr:hypothetical protein AS593_07510 [Caulobacter vibrioides]
MSFLESIRTTTSRRPIITAVTGVAVLATAFAALYFFALRKPYGVLFTDLRTMDAATIVADLDKRKIPYRLENGGATILVPQDVVDATRLEVMGADLPLKGAVGFELFNKSDMGLTEFAQKINYQRALQGELARTIMSMDGVDAARVHLTIPEQTIFREDRRPPKASVTITPRKGAVLSALTVKGVQRLVAAAVPELDTADVVILDEHGQVVSNDATRELASAGGRLGVETVRQHYTALIRQRLEALYPRQDLDVAVFADPSALPLVQTEGDFAWPNGPRRFGLRVSIAVDPPLTAEAQIQARDLVAEAIGFNPALGDLITFPAAPEPLRPTAGAPTIALQPSPVGKGARGEPSFVWTALVIALLATPLIVLVAIVARRRPGPRGLTDAQRAEYARRLGALLSEEGARGSR